MFFSSVCAWPFCFYILFVPSPQKKNHHGSHGLFRPMASAEPFTCHPTARCRGHGAGAGSALPEPHGVPQRPGAGPCSGLTAMVQTYSCCGIWSARSLADGRWFVVRCLLLAKRCNKNKRIGRWIYIWCMLRVLRCCAVDWHICAWVLLIDDDSKTLLHHKIAREMERCFYFTGCIEL